MEGKKAGFGDRCVSSADIKSRLKHNYFEFRIMSDKQNPHYMEKMINEFLARLRETKFVGYREAIKLAKWHLSKEVKDPNPSV
jgi:hypothetical protein